MSRRCSLLPLISLRIRIFLWQGNISNNVCQEFCSQGGVPGQVRPGAGMPRRQVHPQVGTPPGRYTPRAGMPPQQCMLGDTGNNRVVCILLECIFLATSFHVLGPAYTKRQRQYCDHSCDDARYSGLIEMEMLQNGLQTHSGASS